MTPMAANPLAPILMVPNVLLFLLAVAIAIGLLWIYEVGKRS